jgi:hypothetical protein
MKWPRQYAAAYIKAGTDKDAQKAAVAGCPPEFQDLVRTHIKIHRLLEQYGHKPRAKKNGN